MDGSMVQKKIIDWFAKRHQCARHLCFLGRTRVYNANCISIVSVIFAQLTAECRQACPGMSFPLKIVHSHGEIWTPSNTLFPGPTRVLYTSGISIGSAVFAGHYTVTDRPTNHATRSVTIGRIYVRSTAMRPERFESNYRLSDSFNYYSVTKLITYSFMHQMQNTEYIASQKMNTF